MHHCQVRSRCPQDHAKHPIFFFLFASGTLAGCENKAGNCVLVCHPYLHMVVSTLEKDGHVLDRRGWGAQGGKVQAISVARTILWLSPCGISDYPWARIWLAVACTNNSGSSSCSLLVSSLSMHILHWVAALCLNSSSSAFKKHHVCVHMCVCKFYLPLEVVWL